MTDTSRGEKWLDNKSLETRSEAESYLSSIGQNPNSKFWNQVLDNLYAQEENDRQLEEARRAQEELDIQILEERRQQDIQEGRITNQISRFIRKILRGII